MTAFCSSHIRPPRRSKHQAEHNHDATMMRGRILSFVLSLSSAEAWLSQGFFTQSSLIPSFPRTSSSAQKASSSSSDMNVVLAPTDNDPTAFDSFKIGNARVHRYSRSEDRESETEYVMWYHGRSKQFDEENKLPPLSTGRVGRATSRNGLVWEKDTKGSVSEDITGVSLGLNTAEWWGFDTSHVGLGNVLLPMTTPGTTIAKGLSSFVRIQRHSPQN